MPPGSSGVPAVDPIELLSQHIAPAVKKKGSIKLTSKLVSAVKTELRIIRTSKAYVPDSSIATIVSALDEHDEICSRLDSATFGIILQTLLHAKYSRQKERGIVLLAASLHHDANKTPPLKTIEARKTAVGAECLQQLLSCFINSLENARVRRWVGVLMLQLFEGDDKNRMAFESGPEDDKRKLGTMVVAEQNEIVRITCGQLLRTLITRDIPIQDLWPVGSDPTLYNEFPTISQNEKHWNNAFQGYVDEHWPHAIPSENNGRLYFAQALAMFPMGTQVSACTISILVDEDVSICTQSTNAHFTESFEIPFQLIAKYEIKERTLEGNVEGAVLLILRLKQDGAISCYRNSVPVNINEIQLTVRDADLAYNISQDLLPPMSSQKASQSKETIAIAKGCDDALSPEENQLDDDDSNKERTDFSPNSGILCSREESQDNEQEVEFDNFIRENPRENLTLETGTALDYGPGEPLTIDTSFIATPIYEDNKNEGEDQAQFRSSAPARLSRQIESDVGAVAEQERIQDHDIKIDDPASSRILRPKAPSKTPAIKSVVSDDVSDEDLEEIIRPAAGRTASPTASLAASPIAITQPKFKVARSKPKPKPKAKQRVSKSDSPDEEIQKAKKYTLKPRTEPPIIKEAASKRTSGPKISASKATVSKAGPKVLAPNPELTFQLVSGLVTKARNKKVSSLLVPKKPAAKEIPNQHARQSLGNPIELDLEPHDEQNSRSSQKHDAVRLELNSRGFRSQKVSGPNRIARRLSEMLVDIDDIEQGDASFGELIQTSPIYQPLQMAAHTENSSTSVHQRIPVPSQEVANSSGKPSPEIMHVSYHETPSTPVGHSSESSPSPLDRVSPIPLPVQEASPAKYLGPEVTDVPLEVLSGHIGLRRSPRLAFQYSTGKAPVALNNVPVEALHEVGKHNFVDLSENDELQFKNGNWDGDSHFKANEAPLFDEYLARKTPLVSFGVKGPRNQGINSSMQSSLRRIRKVEIPEKRLLPTQTYTRIHSSKRKRDKENTPVMENNKRRQTSRLMDSKESTNVAREEYTVAFHNAEKSRNRLAAQKAARFGSQGSRVNENGSPRGNSNSLQDHTNYKAIVRKTLAVTNQTPMNKENHDDAFIYYSNEEGLNEVESDQGFVVNLPTTPSASFKVRQFSPRPNEEVVKRHLPRPNLRNVEYGKIKTSFANYQQEKIVDPFLKEGHERDLSTFARRLQYRRLTPIRKAKGNLTPAIPQKSRYSMYEDQEVTLVNLENEKSMREYCSSSDNTAESCDGDQNHEPCEAALEVQQAQCDEWRMALKPHQRGILDVLHQVSADLVRYLISHEQVVEDVLIEYEQGGAMLVKNLEQAHQDARRRVRHEMEKVKGTMVKEYRGARLEISRIDTSIRARPIREMEKEWIQEQEKMQRLVEEGKRNFS